MAKCEFCGKPITRIPRIVEQTLPCTCGAKYYAIIGDASDAIESILDLVDCTSPEPEHIEIAEDRVVAVHRGKKAVAREIEKNLWFVFFT